MRDFSNNRGGFDRVLMAVAATFLTVSATSAMAQGRASPAELAIDAAVPLPERRVRPGENGGRRRALLPARAGSAARQGSRLPDAQLSVESRSTRRSFVLVGASLCQACKTSALARTRTTASPMLCVVAAPAAG